MDSPQNDPSLLLTETWLELKKFREQLNTMLMKNKGQNANFF